MYNFLIKLKEEQKTSDGKYQMRFDTSDRILPSKECRFMTFTDEIAEAISFLNLSQIESITITPVQIKNINYVEHTDDN